MYEFEAEIVDDCDNSKGEKVCLQSEAVTLTTGDGVELLGLKPPNQSVPVVVADQPEKLHNGHEKTVGAKAVKLLDHNFARRTALVQNTGGANIRVGAKGVTATSGLRLIPNAVEIFTVPDVYHGEIWAIREGDTDSVAFSQETTAVMPRHEHEHHEHHHERHDQKRGD